MSGATHRVGVSEAFLVKRQLSLDHVPQSEQLSEAMQGINALAGMDDVRYDAARLRLRLAYDASKLNIDDIRQLLTAQGIVLKNTAWSRFRTGYYRFVDQNIRDNARHEPVCCHRPPGSSKH